MIRYTVYFLGIVLFCTIVSKSIHDYLLPVVSTTNIVRGTVKVKQTVTGKIGLDEEQLREKQVILTSSIEGKMIDFSKVEGNHVEAGEVIGHI